MKEITRLTGSKKGPISVIMAGVHGNEPCGVLAFEALLPHLKIDSGTVYFIIGNPNAIAEQKRFTDSNLNRAFMVSEEISDSNGFPDYELARAKYLRTYLDKADALLDIHSSMTSDSPPFIICEDNALSIAKALPASLIVHGFDEINPGGTDYYMNRRHLGKYSTCGTPGVGICIECGQHEDPNAQQVAKQAIVAFLAARGHTHQSDTQRDEQKRFVVQWLHVTEKECFKPVRKFKDFEFVRAGTLIGIESGKYTRAFKTKRSSARYFLDQDIPKENNDYVEKYKGKISLKKDACVLFVRTMDDAVRGESFVIGNYID